MAHLKFAAARGVRAARSRDLAAAARDEREQKNSLKKERVESGPGAARGTGSGPTAGSRSPLLRPPAGKPSGSDRPGARACPCARPSSGLGVRGSGRRCRCRCRGRSRALPARPAPHSPARLGPAVRCAAGAGGGAGRYGAGRAARPRSCPAAAALSAGARAGPAGAGGTYQVAARRRGAVPTRAGAAPRAAGSPWPRVTSPGLHSRPSFVVLGPPESLVAFSVAPRLKPTIPRGSKRARVGAAALAPCPGAEHRCAAPAGSLQGGRRALSWRLAAPFRALAPLPSSLLFAPSRGNPC